MDVDAFLNLAERIIGDGEVQHGLENALPAPKASLRVVDGRRAQPARPQQRTLAQRLSRVGDRPGASGEYRAVDRIRISGIVGNETLWAERTRDGHHRLVSVPFISTDLSLGDIVATVAGADGEPPVFDYVVRESGYSTVVVVLVANALQAQLRLPATVARIAELSAAFEQVKEVVSFAVTSARLAEVRKILEAAEASGILRFSVMSERVPYRTAASNR